MIRIFKFSATWCNPCKALAKQLDGITLPITSYDVDEHEDLVEKYNIRNVPTLIFVDDADNELKRLVGAVTKQKVIDTYNELQ